MDLVKAEIERKKKELAEKKSIDPKKRYFRKGDLKKLEESKENDEVKKQKLSYRTNIVIETAQSKFEKNDSEDSLIRKFEEDRIEKEKGKIMPRKDVIKFFREKNQPILLFGETEYESYQRMKKIQLLEPESVGLRNDLIAALDKVDDTGDESLALISPSKKKDNEEEKINVEIKDEEIPQEVFQKIKISLASYISRRDSTGRDDASREVNNIAKLNKPIYQIIDEEISRERKEIDIASEYVLVYLKSLFTKWGGLLNSRSREEKMSYYGKIASATYTQSVEYVKPLFHNLKQRCCQPDILDSLVKISVLLMDRNYQKANDAYLELAIGNAPWPLGVTNHGIHSRTAQEKIYTKNVAHVLNDETQRKYIQAIKRLMTKAQEFYPADPSRCVNYMGKR